MADGAWVAASIALGGVILTQVVVVSLDHRRARREDSRRWHADRRQIYAEFLANGFEVLALLRGMQSPHPDVNLLQTRHDKMTLSLQKIRLTSSDQVVDVAAAYWSALNQVVAKVTADPSGFPQYLLARAATDYLIDRFVLETRRELGVIELREQDAST